MAALHNRLKAMRTEAGKSQQALADLVGISRQAYFSVESGQSNPSTEVALRLARALNTSVDRLFSLPDDVPDEVAADLIGLDEQGPANTSPGRVQLVTVGRRLLARPVLGPTATRYALAPAGGVIVGKTGAHNRVVVQPFDPQEAGMTTLGLMGCDPAGAYLGPGLQRNGVQLVWSEEGSYQALAGLARGEGHVAGCHLRDEETGKFNHSWVKRMAPFPCTLVTFAAWRQGLIVAPANPLAINSIEDLARPEVTIVNRPAGSGSRSLLDRLLKLAGISPAEVSGYDREAPGHLTVAWAVSSGLVDAGVGVEAAATALGQGFVPLEEERYDLVIPDHFLDHPGVQALLDLLRQPGLHRRVETLGGYDVSGMGQPASDN